MHFSGAEQDTDDYYYSCEWTDKQCSELVGSAGYKAK